MCHGMAGLEDFHLTYDCDVLLAERGGYSDSLRLRSELVRQVGEDVGLLSRDPRSTR